VRAIVSKTGLEEVKKHFHQQFEWQAEDRDVSVLGVSQLIDLSDMKVYLLLEVFDRVFLWAICRAVKQGPCEFMRAG
jgi:hypothetical protein